MFFKSFVTGFIVTLPLLTVAGTIEVCSSCAVSSVRQAIEMASPGDSILIKQGLYNEGNIIIDKPLYIIGEGYPKIDGNNEFEIFTVISDSVWISGIQFQNIGVNYIEDRAAINLVGCNGCIIKDNKLIDTFFAIYLQKSKNCIIENNYIQGNAVREISSGNAIHAWYCDSLIIENNNVRNHRDGIYLEFVDNSRIRFNISTNNVRYGLHFMFSDDDLYEGNTFESNGAGVAVMFSKNIKMIGNKFLKNWGTAAYGLLLKEITDGEISGNWFYENTSGIYAESASRMKITGNDFERNGWALKILGSCVDNIFSDNNFLSNTFDLTTNSARNSNIYINNYWSEYTGYDLDKDGIGDVPHRPIKLFSYVVSMVPESIVLLRSLFVDVINFAESVTPAFSPEALLDQQPMVRKIVR